jgi:biotin carboxylase
MKSDKNPSRRCLLYLDLWRPSNEAYRALAAAERLGIDVVMLARNIPAALRGTLKDYRLVDTFDHAAAVEAAIELAAAYDFAGVARWLDRSVEIGADIAERLGLPGPGRAVAHLCRHKYKMKQALAGLDVTPRNVLIRSEADLESALDYVGMPAVLKPAGASASRGIFRVDSLSSLRHAFATLSRVATPEYDDIFRMLGGEYVLESFVPGPLISVEGFVTDDTIHFVGIIDHLNTDDYYLDFRHVYPADLDQADEAAIYDAATRILRKLGLKHSAFQIEGLLSPEGFKFLEIAARTAGDYNSTHLLPSGTGTDHLANYLRVVMGDEPDCPKVPVKIAGHYVGTQYVIATQSGHYRGLAGIEAASNIAGFDHLYPELSIETRITLPPDDFMSCRVAAVFAQSTSSAGVKNTLAEACAKLQPIIECD